MKNVIRVVDIDDISGTGVEVAEIVGSGVFVNIGGSLGVGLGVLGEGVPIS
jgi:hypothetical protein